MMEKSSYHELSCILEHQNQERAEMDMMSGNHQKVLKGTMIQGAREAHDGLLRMLGQERGLCSFPVLGTACSKDGTTRDC
jgi:hypothetical protein